MTIYKFILKDVLNIQMQNSPKYMYVDMFFSGVVVAVYNEPSDTLTEEQAGTQYFDCPQQG